MLRLIDRYTKKERHYLRGVGPVDQTVLQRKQAGRQAGKNSFVTECGLVRCAACHTPLLFLLVLSTVSSTAAVRNQPYAMTDEQCPAWSILESPLAPKSVIALASFGFSRAPPVSQPLKRHPD